MYISREGEVAVSGDSRISGRLSANPCIGEGGRGHSARFRLRQAPPGRHHAALARPALHSPNPQSSQGVSAARSAASTVEPHQMRSEGGASR